MEQLLSVLPQLVDIVQKGGVTGVLLLACGVLVYEIRRGRRHLHEMRNELAAVYGQRDKALFMLVQVKTVCESHDIKVDFSDVSALMDRLAPALPSPAKT